MIFLLLPLLVGAIPLCRVEVKNNFPLQRGFIDAYLSQKVFEILTETGWVPNCKNGTTVEVVVNSVSYRGATISQNRFGGYTFTIEFTVKLPDREYRYTLTRYVDLPNPSEGTLPIRSALIDLLDSYQIMIKKDLLNYLRERENNSTLK